MENASKALLIAAAVLIVIIIITIGIKIYTSSSDTQKVALNTGDAISDKTWDATDSVISSITGKNATGNWSQDKTSIKNSKTGQTIEVGDIVNYDCGVSSYTGQWGVLGVENGNLLLMSTKRVKSITLDDKKYCLAEGTKKINNECNSYKNVKYAVSARSIELEDIYIVIGYIPPASVTYTYTKINGKIRGYDQYYSSSATVFEHPDGRKLQEGESIEITFNPFEYVLLNKYIDRNNKAYNFFTSDTYCINSKCIKRI